jgi:outer membrane lipoprotein-sorting protein
MKKQKISFAIVTLLLCSSLILGGCTQQNSSQDQSKPPLEESLTEILAKAETIESVYYEIDTSLIMSDIQIQNSTMKIWQKIPYLKEEVSYILDNVTTNFTVIKRPEGIYRYDNTQNKYLLDPGIVIPQLSTEEAAKDLLNNQTITILGTETYDGNMTTVIQYTPHQIENSTIIKMWIWNEKGIPLKAQVTTKKEETIMMMEYQYRNYSFSDIPESTFNVI